MDLEGMDYIVDKQLPSNSIDFFGLVSSETVKGMLSNADHSFQLFRFVCVQNLDAGKISAAQVMEFFDRLFQ
jgi:hypothetical protein